MSNTNISVVFIVLHLLLAPDFGNGDNLYDYQDNWNETEDTTKEKWSDDRQELQDNVDNVSDDGLFGHLPKATDHRDYQDTLSDGWNGMQDDSEGDSDNGEESQNITGNLQDDIVSVLKVVGIGVAFFVVLALVLACCKIGVQRLKQMSLEAQSGGVYNTENASRRFEHEIRCRAQQLTLPNVNESQEQNSRSERPPQARLNECREQRSRSLHQTQPRLDDRAPLVRQDSAVQEVLEYLSRENPTLWNTDQDVELALINERHDGTNGQLVDVEITGAAAGSSHSSHRPTEEIDRHASHEVETLLELQNDHLKSPAVHLEVKRDEIFQDLLQRYNDQALAEKRIIVKMKGERGMDCGGVTNDMFTKFWNEVQEKYFKGNEAVVPYLPKNRRKTEETHYRVFGRILSHTVAVTKSLPMPLCKSAIIGMVFNTNDVDKQAVLEDFLLFLDQEDRHLITTAINNFGVLEQEQIDKIQDLFTSYDYSAVVQERTFIDNLTQIARDTICIEPKYLLELMRQGIPESHLQHFWSMLNIPYIDVLFRALRPSRQDVLNCLSPQSSDIHLTERQQRVFRYLCYLIQELNQTELEAFLHFVTGKKSMPRRGITVGFTNETGLQRTPKAHTCSNMLKLPETYENYNVFKSEFKHLLAADEAFTMTMA